MCDRMEVFKKTNCRVALAAARTAERALQSRWDATWKEEISRKKRYAEYERNSREDWNDGWRVPSHWPLERELTPPVDPDRGAPVQPEKRMKSEGIYATKTKEQAVRVTQKISGHSRDTG